MHRFFGLLRLSFSSGNARQVDFSSYRFPGVTMVKTEDDFNVCLGLLLVGWDVRKGTGLRPLAHHVVKVLEDFSNFQAWEGPIVKLKIRDVGSECYITQFRTAPSRARTEAFKDPFLLQDLFPLFSFSLQKSNCRYYFHLPRSFCPQTTCHPIVKLCRRSRLFLHLATLPLIHLPFNHLLRCFRPLQISWWYTFDQACRVLVDFNYIYYQKTIDLRHHSTDAEFDEGCDEDDKTIFEAEEKSINLAKVCIVY